MTDNSLKLAKMNVHKLRNSDIVRVGRGFVVPPLKELSEKVALFRFQERGLRC
jgi:hypothetical protein